MTIPDEQIVNNEDYLEDGSMVDESHVTFVLSNTWARYIYDRETGEWEWYDNSNPDD